MKKILIVLAVVLVVASGAYIAFASKKSPVAAPAAAGPATVEAKKGSVSVAVEGAAIISAYQQVTLRAPGAAVITSIKRSGENVEKGGTVASLDNDNEENTLAQAELLLSQAVLDADKAALALQRAKKDEADTRAMVDSKAASPDALTLSVENVKNSEIAAESAKVKVSLARLAVDRSRREVQGAQIRAPFTGTILKTFAEQGDLVGANVQIALFGDISQLRATAEVDEFDIGKIAVGQTVTISGDSIGEDPIRSRIESISPMAEIVNNISIFTVTALLENTEGLLRPGMSADFSILIKSDKGLVVPSKCISTVRGRSYLEILANGEVAKVRVEVGADDGINIVVLSGIEEGALVVIPGAAPVAPAAAPASSSGEKSVLPITIPGSGGVK